jgi:hypothetical protein
MRVFSKSYIILFFFIPDFFFCGTIFVHFSDPDVDNTATKNLLFRFLDFLDLSLFDTELSMLKPFKRQNFLDNNKIK